MYLSGVTLQKFGEFVSKVFLWFKTALKISFGLVISAISLFPLYWSLNTALKPLSEVMVYPPHFFPHTIKWSNFIEAWNYVPFAQFFKNSLIITVISVISVLFFSSLSGYGFSKFNFRGKSAGFILILASLMLPWQVLMIPLYLMMARVHLVDTIWAVLLPILMSAFGTFLMRQYIETIPRALIDSARIDGASEFHIYREIILPNVKSSLSALMIFTTMWVWNWFIWPLVVLNSPSKMTVPVGLQMFQSNMGVNRWNLMMAAVFISIIPVLIVFIIFQRNFIKGMTLSGLKA